MKTRIVIIIVFVLMFSNYSMLAQPVGYLPNKNAHDSLIHRGQLIVRNAAKDTIEIAKWRNG